MRRAGDGSAKGRAPGRPPGTPRSDWFHLPRSERRQRGVGAGRPRRDGLPALVTVPELAELGGKTERQIDGWLKHRPDLVYQPGGPRTKRYIYLSAIVIGAREMYASLIERRHAQRLAELEAT